MITASFTLAGKHALVTGAGRGLGRGIAEALAAAGARVTVCARSQPELEDAARGIRDGGGLADILVADVTQVARFAEAVNGIDPIDIFVNNAGTNRPKPLSEVTEEDYDAVMGLNLRASLFAAKAVSQRMIKAGRRGSIINMSSQMGHVGARNRTLYCASKWAIEGFTKALAVELANDLIRVNTLCPTFIETPMVRPFLDDDAFKSSVLDKIKLGRIGQVQDIVGAAVFLASDASSLMTGSSLLVDGGWTAE
ncbi:3-oxoacyl-ACP reductase [Rhizobium sp. Root149]|uniref:SDR family NAD(P)-dependent oxidoreductase n=1 Tax=Rhizobium sp. Root149 TaxID=1736473 RepID=UPI000714F65D|nr:SDR family NAD(P)-dependent oxidoreductase [Rhizobium sp. Root149]KQZ46640.1 3-oxoacyl-ACP reductase [Rhizobium sp. Root149]